MNITRQINSATGLSLRSMQRACVERLMANLIVFPLSPWLVEKEDVTTKIICLLQVIHSNSNDNYNNDSDNDNHNSVIFFLKLDCVEFYSVLYVISTERFGQPLFIPSMNTNTKSVETTQEDTKCLVISPGCRLQTVIDCIGFATK